MSYVIEIIFTLILWHQVKKSLKTRLCLFSFSRVYIEIYNQNIPGVFVVERENMVSITSFQIQRNALIPFIFLCYPHIINNPGVSIGTHTKKKECILTFYLRKNTYSCAWAVLIGIDVNCVHFLRLNIKASKANKKNFSFCVLNRLLFQLGGRYMTPFSLFTFYILILFIIDLCKHTSVIF